MWERIIIFIRSLSSFASFSWVAMCAKQYPLVMTNITIENGPFIADLLINHCDFS